tara:strand:+ start:8079 stop:8825 length:747 start_codon:yes stop_codon:yes gene_type:complete
MAGHSKFKNIMHRKGAQDKKRGKIFSRLGREISVAVKSGGPDPESNIRLRTAISSAKTLNMPKDNILRAIKKGEANDPDSNYEEVRYEGYGPSGVAIIVDAMTNNKNRTASEIRSTFSKYGGNLGETGSVSYNFKRLGTIALKKEKSQEEVFEFAIENDSIDFETTEEQYVIYCDPKNLNILNEKVINKFNITTEINIIWKSDTSINIESANAEKLFKLLNILEENEDVQNVSSNFEVSDQIMNQLTT